MYITSKYMESLTKIFQKETKPGKWSWLGVEAISYLFIALFTYTAFSKLITYASFEKVLSDMPLLGDYSRFFALAIPITEFIVSTLLIIPKRNKTGLWASLVLMILFTVYLVFMIITQPTLPCSCGGIISWMSWQQHVVFNSALILLALFAVITNKKPVKKTE